MRVNNNYDFSNITFANKSEKNTSNDMGKTFTDVIAVKVAETDQKNVLIKTSEVMDLFGSRAPDEVKKAWMEAEEETGVHITKCGLCITPDGKHSCMTTMGVQIALKWAKGELDQADLMGSSVESAINTVNTWIYDLDHPLAGQPAKSIDEQRMIMQERAFYEAFLEKLMRFYD